MMVTSIALPHTVSTLEHRVAMLDRSQDDTPLLEEMLVVWSACAILSHLLSSPCVCAYMCVHIM